MGLLSCTAEAAIATCDSSIFKTHCPPSRPFQIREFSCSDLDSATNGFSQGNLLGKGSYGFVYRANLLEGRNGFATVAAKVTKQSSAGGTAAAAENEVDVLSRVYHPRLVNLIGYGLEMNRKKVLVVEFMPNGSLYDLLHGSDRPLRFDRRIRFALQVAKAVRFCHGLNPPIIHRDIKSANVLIDGRFNARLGDFGLAVMGRVEDAAAMRTPPAGTLGYLDPGYLAPGDLTPKSDVFSFGTLLMEIISGRNAIDLNHSPSSVVDWAVPLVKSGAYAEICDPRIRLPEDEAAIRHITVLAARCVRKTASNRPTMSEVAGCLKAVYDRLKSPVWTTIRRRVDCVRESTRVAARYEPLEDRLEAGRISRAGSRRTRKGSSVAGAESGGGVNSAKICRHLAKAKSIGSLVEIGYEPLDPGSCQVGPAKNAGLGAKRSTVRLSKSRSLEVLCSSNTTKLLRIAQE
ncbi:unnamed protein product [Cuscuta campestris]|uniref:Protein kinase domain-containing protein n=1 Tax=Cuscuta campestris TaxID=132261 RepID=A0A484ME14_9ASTE|nr:unnamed protein product [Cuscuta campestris]